MDIAARLDSFFATADRPAIVGAYLFGSVARGRAHRESDVDVAVLFDRAHLPALPDRSVAAEHLAGDLMTALQTNRLDLVVLNDAPPLFARHILTAGSCLFSADAEALHAFHRGTLLRAADLQPFVDRGRRRLLEELAR